MPYSAYWERPGQIGFYFGLVRCRAGPREKRPCRKFARCGMIRSNYCPMGGKVLSATNFCIEAQGKVSHPCRLEADECLDHDRGAFVGGRISGGSAHDHLQDDIFVFTAGPSKACRCCAGKSFARKTQAPDFQRNTSIHQHEIVSIAMSAERLTAMETCRGLRVLGFGIEGNFSNRKSTRRVQNQGRRFQRHIREMLSACPGERRNPFLDLIP